MAKLKTETNTRTMSVRVLDAAADVLNINTIDLQADFEHGQWWITHRPSGAQWSVVDATGGRSVDGFDFERIAYGEDE